MIVAEMLADAGIDLIEISGGTYETPTMTGKDVKDSTKAREAYFLEYANRFARVNTPLMVTGGFRTATGMAEKIASGATDLIGMARPLAVFPTRPTTCCRVVWSVAISNRATPVSNWWMTWR
ncbi:MAG: hypothetical protein R3F38_00240 [Gammaproteobacteria bacterium]